MVKLLLLSDIHWLVTAKALDDNLPMRKAFLRDVEDFCEHKGAFDHILISGDIARAGGKEEYSKALDFLDLLCTKTKCSLDQIYVIPGNHDKNFTAGEKAEIAERHIIHSGLSNEASDTDALFETLLRENFDNVKALYKPFEEYHSFASKIDSTDRFMERCLEGENSSPYNSETDILYRKFELNSLGGYKVFLYGMNTALISDWFDVNDGKGHKLFLPKLSYNAEVETEGHINIVMLHHPVSHLVNGDKISEVLDRNFVIQIFGHLHQPASYLNNAVHIMSGALQPHTQDDNKSYYSVYNILEMSVTSGKSQDKLCVKLMVEKYNSSAQSFEEVSDESKRFYVDLKPHVNRWAERQEEHLSALPEGVTVRKVRIAFLQKPDQKYYIDKMDKFDSLCSMSENCVRFLQKMEDNGRMAELWNELNKK